MQPKRASLGLLFCYFSLTILLGGCRPASTHVAVLASPHQGIELTIACPTEATAALLRRYAGPWALRQGVLLTIQKSDPANAKDEDTSKASTAADICILPPADLPSWAAAGRLVPIPAAYQAREHALAWSDLLPTFRDQLIHWEGKPYGLPLVGEAPVCCYRADLLTAPAHQTALHKMFGRELIGPATWEQFARLAEYFRDHRMEGQARPSLPPWPTSDAALDRLFYTVATNFARRAMPSDEARRPDREDALFSFHYDLATGQPRIVSPGFVQALKLLQRLGKCRPKELAAAPEEAFRNGRAVLCLTDAPWIKTFQNTPALHDKVGVCRIPGAERYFDFDKGGSHPAPEGNRVPYLGGSGWLVVVTRSSRHPETAFDLLADLAGPKTSTQIFLSATGHGGPTRTEQLYRARWDTFDLNDKQELHLREAMQETLLHRHLKNPVLCLRTPRQAAHRTALVQGLRKALLEGAEAEQTLREVAEAWRKQDREQGLEEHGADYRRSLGLLAK